MTATRTMVGRCVLMLLVLAELVVTIAGCM